MINYQIMGLNIRKSRMMKGLTIERLAEKAGIGSNFLGKIERGVGIASLETIVKIANALEVGVDYFLDNELLSITNYLETGITEQLARMDKQTKKWFLELVRLNADFFTNKIQKEKSNE